MFAGQILEIFPERIRRDVRNDGHFAGIGRRSARAHGWANLDPVDPIVVRVRKARPGAMRQAFSIATQQQDGTQESVRLPIDEERLFFE